MAILRRYRLGRLLDRRKTGMFLLLALVILMIACQTPRLGLENQTQLVRNKPYEGTQQTMDYQLDYRYVFHKGESFGPDTIDFSGSLTPRRGMTTFLLRLHFLNGDGAVVATHVLYSPGTGNGAARTTINQRIEVPSEAMALAFSHVARERNILS